MTTATPMMTDLTTPLWLKIAATLSVIWYAFGLMQFWLAASMDVGLAVQTGSKTAAHRAAMSATPALIWVAFAVASAAGLIGSILLFGRAPLSKTVFGISLASALVYIFGSTGSVAQVQHAPPKN